MAASLFRFVGGAARNMIVANVFGSFMLLIFMVLGGYILVRGTTSPFFYKKEENNLNVFSIHSEAGAPFFVNWQIK
jgi:hypothetical protein